MSLINNDTRYSHQMNSIKFTISFPLPNIRNPCKIKFHGFQIVPNVINRKISLHVFIDIESRRNFEIPGKSKNNGSTKRPASKRNETFSPPLEFAKKLRARFSDRFRGVSGQLAGRSHPGEGERRRSEKPCPTVPSPFQPWLENLGFVSSTPRNSRGFAAQRLSLELWLLEARGLERKVLNARWPALKRTSPPFPPTLLSYFFRPLEN